jgi:hypothetical protein
MSWRVGPFALLQGASVRAEFNWQGQYHGVQFAQAVPEMDLGPWLPKVYGERELETTNHSVKGRRTDGERVDWIYGVTITNKSQDYWVFFDLTGGEVEP